MSEDIEWFLRLEQFISKKYDNYMNIQQNENWFKVSITTAAGQLKLIKKSKTWVFLYIVNGEDVKTNKIDLAFLEILQF